VDPVTRRDRDSRRSAAYEVEDRWSSLLDNGGVLDFFGSRLTMPVQRRFGTVDAMQTYVDWVLALPTVMQTYGTLPTVVVRARAGQSKAHSDPASSTIAIPLDARWAARESVLLHEIAHHVMARGTAAWHGSAYASVMLELVTCTLGPEAALVLRTGYEDAGIRTVS
jgi:putative metallohydrolase (TIGR04338 family)